MSGVCQSNKEAKDIFFFTKYHPDTDEIEFRTAFLRRIADLDADTWIDGAKEMKTVSLSGWVFFNTVINWPPACIPDGFEPNEFAGMAYDLGTLTDTDGGGGGDGFVG